MNKRILLFFIGFCLLSTLFVASDSSHSKETTDSRIFRVAREIIDSSQYCVLISTDERGFPSARMMDPFPWEPGWTIWMGTNRHTGKVKEIQKNQNASLYYESPDGDGYLLLKGIAYMVDDPLKKKKYFKKGWGKFYPGNRESFILIRFDAIHIEVVSYKNNLIGEDKTWAAPSVSLLKSM
jgi:general stress protein 26